jgi:signal transduction histidine kinase
VTRRLSLQSKLLLAVGLPLLTTVGLGVSSWITQANASASYDTALRWNEHALAAKDETLRATQYMGLARRALEEGDAASRERMEILETELIAAAKHSTVLAQTFGPAEVDEELELHALIEQLIRAVSQSIALGKTDRAAGTRQYENTAVLLRDALVAKLDQRVREETEGARIWQASAKASAEKQTALELLVGFAAFLILIPSLAMARQMRNGIAALSSGASRVAVLDFSVPVTVTTNNELADLAAGFNQMSAAIQAHRGVELEMAVAAGRLTALEEGKAGLEALVIERTAALAQLNVELKRSMLALEQGQARLHVSERLASIGTMAAGIAHEINNPVGYVTSNLTFALEELDGLVPSATWEKDDLERVRGLIGALEEAREGGRRIAAIVKDMKVLSRVDTEEPTESVDLHAVLESAANIACAELQKTSRLRKQFGPCPKVVGNAGQLGQVFLNLIVNAAQAMPPGRNDNLVTVVTRTGDAGEAIVEVIDNGLGIPEAVRRRVFDPFFTTKPVGVGTGLGLSICHRLVTQQAGRIEFDTESGKGTTFRVLFPEGATL